MQLLGTLGRDTSDASALDIFAQKSGGLGFQGWGLQLISDLDVTLKLQTQKVGRAAWKEVSLDMNHPATWAKASHESAGVCAQDLINCAPTPSSTGGRGQ